MLTYDIYAFGGMIRDKVRTDGYAQALRACINKDSVVLDIGTGVGIWALLACRFGARKVYAIDPNDVIQVARDVAVANGYADRIEFIQEMSTKISLPEPADILVTDMHGIVPMFEQNLPSIIDARARLLASGGTMIPRRDTLWAVPVESAASFERVAQPWADRPYGFEWAPAARVAANDWFKVKAKVTSADFLGKPATWATLDYRQLENPNVSGQLTTTASRAGTGHGFLIWFDAELSEGIGFSNAPDCPETIFGQAFFPWVHPVPITEGDLISIDIRCDLVGTFHLWRWKTSIKPRTASSTIEFSQSTFLNMPLSEASLHKRSPEHKAKLNRDGEIRQFILSQMNGQNSIDRIGEEALAKFPNSFTDKLDARSAVAYMAERYSE